VYYSCNNDVVETNRKKDYMLDNILLYKCTYCKYVSMENSVSYNMIEIIIYP
jgi:hypothetical protein